MFGFDILQIASNAALNGLILVTSKTREFTRIFGLRVEDWSVRFAMSKPNRKRKKEPNTQLLRKRFLQPFAFLQRKDYQSQLGQYSRGRS